MPIKRAEFTADEIVFIIERASARVMRLAISKIRFVHLPRKMAIVADETKGKNPSSPTLNAREGEEEFQFDFAEAKRDYAIFVTEGFRYTVVRSKGNNARRI